MSGGPTKIVFIAFLMTTALISIDLSVTVLDDVCADTFYVGGAGSGNYSSIQGAIDAANPGSTVFVYNGTYYENVIVNKTINLIGENEDMTIIDGGGSGDVVKITAEWTNISRFTITNSGNSDIPDFDSGIQLDFVDRCTIIDCHVTNNFDGLLLSSSHNNTIMNNTISGNEYDGIFIVNSNDNEICKNIISDDRYGIWLDRSNRNLIRNNIVFSNDKSGIWIEWDSNNNHFFRNSIFSNNEDGIWVVEFSKGTIADYNNIYNNAFYGVNASPDSNVNTINNWWGDASGPYHPTKNPDGIGDNVSDYVDFDPWLTSPITSFGPVHNLDKDIFYNSIQVAIDDADVGDTIFVSNGTYYENVLVNKSINLTGEDSETTIIDGGGSGNVISITVDWVNISGLALTGGDAGIELENVHNCSVKNNEIWGNGNGIVLESSTVNHIIGNTASSNSVRGIHLEDSMDNDIIDNIALNNKYGIELTSSCDNTISENNASWNFRDGILLDSSMGNLLDGNMMIENGLYIEGDSLEHWNTHFIDTSNKINGKPVYYWKNQTGGSIPSNAGQVILANCTNVRVEDQELTNGSVGIQLGFSTDNDIINNNVSFNWIGIKLFFSGRNNITRNIASWNVGECILLVFSSGNNITDNEVYYGEGIFLESSNLNNIIGNTAYSNDLGGIALSGSNWNVITENSIWSNDNGFYLWKSNWNQIIKNTVFLNTEFGIVFEESLNNEIYHNDFVDNQEQAFDDSNDGNQWNASYSDGGNFWSDYDGDDEFSGPDQDQAGSDGIGDTPYTIEGGSNQDNYPFIEALIMDIVPPSVLSTYPENEAIDIAIDTEIIIEFSESMDVQSVESAISISPETDYFLLWNNTNETLTINFSEPLAHETLYTISINKNAKDLAGISLENQYEFEFTTVAESEDDSNEEEDLSTVLLLLVLLIAIVVIIIILFLVKKKKAS